MADPHRVLVDLVSDVLLDLAIERIAAPLTAHLLELQFEVVHLVVPHEVRRHDELSADLRKPRGLHGHLLAIVDEALAVLRAEPTEVVATHDLEDTGLQHRRGLEDIVDSAKTTKTIQQTD